MNQDKLVLEWGPSLVAATTEAKSGFKYKTWQIIENHGNDVETLAKHLKAFMEKSGLPAGSDLAILVGPLAVEKPLTLTQAPEAELRAAIPYLFERQYAMKLDTFLYSFTSTGLSMEAPVSGQHFIFALPETESKTWSALASALGLNLAAVLPRTMAWGASLGRIRSALAKSGEDYAVCEVGAGQTYFKIFRKGLPLVLRNLDLGLDDFNRAIREYAAEKGMDAQQAGALCAQLTGEAASGNHHTEWLQTMQAIMPRMRPLIERWGKELLGCMQYYRSQSWAGELKDLYLCGKVPQVPGLEVFLEAEAGLSLAALDEGDGASIFGTSAEWKWPERSWEKVLGVLGFGLISSSTTLNLVPWSDLKAAGIRRLSQMLRMTLVTVSLIGAVCLAFMWGGIHRETMKRASLAHETAQAAELIKVYESQEASRRFLRQVSSGQIELPVFLKELSSMVPEGVLLDSFTYEASTGVMVVGGTTPLEGDYLRKSAEFVEKLNQSPFLVRAELAESEVNTEGQRYRFSARGLVYSFEDRWVK